MSYGLKILSANGRTVINTDERFVGQKIRGTSPVNISLAGSSWPPTGLLSQELPMCKTRDLTSGVIGLYYGDYGLSQPTFAPETYGAPSNGLQWWPLSKQGGAVTVANYNVDFGGDVSFRGYNTSIPVGSVNPTTFNSRPIRFVQWSSTLGLQIAFGSNGGNTGWTTVTVNNTSFSRSAATYTAWDGTQEVWTWSGVSNPFPTTGTFTLDFIGNDDYGLKVITVANYNVDFGGGLIVSFRGYNTSIPVGSVNPTTFNSRPIRFVQWSSNFGLQIAFGSNGGNSGWTTVTVNNTSFSRTDATFTSWDGTQEVWTWSGVSNPFPTTGTFTLHFTGNDDYGLKVFNSAGGLAFDGSDIGVGLEIVAAGTLTAKTGTFTMEAGRDPSRYVVDVSNTRITTQQVFIFTGFDTVGSTTTTVFEQSYYFDRTNDKIIVRNWSYPTDDPSNTSGTGYPFEYMIGYLLY